MTGEERGKARFLKERTDLFASMTKKAGADGEVLAGGEKEVTRGRRYIGNGHRIVNFPPAITFFFLPVKIFGVSGNRN